MSGCLRYYYVASSSRVVLPGFETGFSGELVVSRLRVKL